MKSLYTEIVDCINKFMDNEYTEEDERIATFILSSLRFYDNLKAHGVIKEIKRNENEKLKEIKEFMERSGKVELMAK